MPHVQLFNHLFEAFLRCPTKCWLLSRGEIGTGNEYAEWAKARAEAYRIEGLGRLREMVPVGECVVGPGPGELARVKRRLTVDVEMLVAGTRLRIDAVEREHSRRRGRPAEFVPIRFVFRNKVTQDDHLLIGNDALALSEAVGRNISFGKIIHGDDHSILKVKAAPLLDKTRKLIMNVAEIMGRTTSPEIILNRHCSECEFRDNCRAQVVEKDDLSLLANMTPKERNAIREKGIFTVTQLSFTFRPRRRPKRMRDKRERYHHALKARAIREKKIHIVGTPELKFEGTPVYLDVEGLPDRDFYYLIGVRIRSDASAVQHSLWADIQREEERIWHEFLDIIRATENPLIIHYGGYETTFLNRMRDLYGPSADVFDTVLPKTSRLNLLSFIYGQIYFPTYSNGLKDISGALGFQWSPPAVSGQQAILWRHAWEESRVGEIKEKILTYNRQDCEALELVVQAVSRLTGPQPSSQREDGTKAEAVRVDELKPPYANKWRVFSSPQKALEIINRAAHWDYQRGRVYARSNKQVRRAQLKRKPCPRSLWRVDGTIRSKSTNRCPRCERKGEKHGPIRSVVVQDILFGRSSLKRRVIRYEWQEYWCPRCKATFGTDRGFPRRKRTLRYGKNLLAYLFYQLIDLGISIGRVREHLSRIFGLTLNPGTIASFKEALAGYYSDTQQQILKRVVAGNLVHVDETHVTIKRRRAYVWVFTNMCEVAYVYSETREGDIVQRTLEGFKGVVVSDFYVVYDSVECEQQKCLIHLVRDLNEELLRNPYDEEFKHITQEFGLLLKAIVEDVDKRGLKKHFLQKHLRSVRRFYRKVIEVDYRSGAALACKERFRKNREKLFTFLRFDGIPWNNNNAEHAIKAFARLREYIESGATEKGIREYLTLLSVCQTCKYQGLDFLSFLRSGETDIQAFAEKQPKRRLSNRISLD